MIRTPFHRHAVGVAQAVDRQAGEALRIRPRRAQRAAAATASLPQPTFLTTEPSGSARRHTGPSARPNQ